MKKPNNVRWEDKALKPIADEMNKLQDAVDYLELKEVENEERFKILGKKNGKRTTRR